MKNKRAIIYTRVSTDEQADKGYSLKYQLERLQLYCENKDIQIEQHFQDDHSAKTFQRPQFLKLLEYTKSNRGNFELLLIFKLEPVFQKCRRLLFND